MGNFTRELDGTLQGVAASVRAEAGEHLAGAEGRRTVQKCCFSLSVEISHVFYQKKKKKKSQNTEKPKEPHLPSSRPTRPHEVLGECHRDSGPPWDGPVALAQGRELQESHPLRLGSPPAELVLK